MLTHSNLPKENYKEEDLDLEEQKLAMKINVANEGMNFY